MISLHYIYHFPCHCQALWLFWNFIWMLDEAGAAAMVSLCPCALRRAHPPTQAYKRSLLQTWLSCERA